MTLFALTYHYSTDAELVSTHRPAHRQYLAGLLERGDLLVAGPLGEPGPPRGLLVLDVGSAADVERIAEDDPFTACGAIVEHSVGAWTLSFGAHRLEARPDLA